MYDNFSIYHPEGPFIPGDWILERTKEGIIIIDGFYKNPLQVLEIAKKSVYTNHFEFTSYAPVFRSVFFAGLDPIKDKLQNEIPEIDHISFSKFHFFNLQSKQTIIEQANNRCPHLDANSPLNLSQIEYSIIVYLTDEGIGTRFYKNPSDTTSCQTLVSTPEFLRNWEISRIVDGKFNRAVLFPSSQLFHKIDSVSHDIDFNVRVFQTTSFTVRST